MYVYTKYNYNRQSVFPCLYLVAVPMFICIYLCFSTSAGMDAYV